MHAGVHAEVYFEEPRLCPGRGCPSALGQPRHASTGGQQQMSQSCAQYLPRPLGSECLHIKSTVPSPCLLVLLLRLPRHQGLVPCVQRALHPGGAALAYAGMGKFQGTSCWLQHHGDEQDTACLLSCDDVRSWHFSSFVAGGRVCKDTWDGGDCPH